MCHHTTPHQPQVLLLLARRQTSLLSRFGAFLASILDHLECFSDAQLRQVFEMFAALTGEGGQLRPCIRFGGWPTSQRRHHEPLSFRPLSSLQPLHVRLRDGPQAVAARQGHLVPRVDALRTSSTSL